MSKTRLIIAAVAAGAIALTGCSSDGDDPPQENNNAQSESGEGDEEAPAAEGGDEPEFDEAALREAFETIDLGSDDIGYGVERQQHEDDLSVPTNDICGRSWDSNSNRILRDQGYFWTDGDSAMSPIVSNEAVAYKPGTGANAMSEIEDAVAGCDGWSHDGGDLDGVHIVEPPAGALDGSFAWQATDKRDGTDYHYGAVYQINADLVSVVYVWSTDEGELSDVLGAVIPNAAEKLGNAL